jgi:hypothetical protein
MLSKHSRQTITVFLIVIFIAGCGSTQSQMFAPLITPITPTNSIVPSSISTPFPPKSSIVPFSSLEQRSPAFDLSYYAFPDFIETTQHYMFYLHGKIIEDQGIPAVSPEYGEYEYGAILEKLSSYGFIVISEQRAKNTDNLKYAGRIAEQIKTLISAGVPAKNITLVGASQGAWITIYVSHLLENSEVNFVIMAICHPDNIEEFKKDQIYLFGNVLSIYDSSDELAGSCQGLFTFSKDKGISKYKEVVLNIGTGHGILYKPLDEWIIPVVQWTGNP